MLIGSCIALLVLITGAAAYLTLQQVAPKENKQTKQPTSEKKPENESLTKANQIKESAQTSFSERNYADAAIKFSEAAALYKQAEAGPQEAEMLDMQRIAEHEDATLKKLPQEEPGIEASYDPSDYTAS